MLHKQHDNEGGNAAATRILKKAIQTLPDQCFISKQHGTSILHEVCANLLPNELLHLTLARFPEIAMMINRNGDSIAHVICSHPQSTPGMIHTLAHHCSARIFAIQDSNGDLPLHLVNADDTHRCEEIIQLLLHYYPQAITVPNAEMHTPLTARLTRESPSNLKAMIQYSDHTIVRNILEGIHGHRIIRRRGGNAGFTNATTHVYYMVTVIEEVFLLLQRHLSSLCNNLQQEVTSATLYSLHWTSSKFLSQDIEYMYCLNCIRVNFTILM